MITKMFENIYDNWHIVRKITRVFNIVLAWAVTYIFVVGFFVFSPAS